MTTVDWTLSAQGAACGLLGLILLLKPDLGDHAMFLVLAALALLWAVYEAFRQGLK